MSKNESKGSFYIIFISLFRVIVKKLFI